MAHGVENKMLGRSAGKLADWFGELRGPLRRFLALRRRVPRGDVEDIAQEVFLRLLRYDRAELVSDPKAYLFKIANNVASEWTMRARQRFPHNSDWLAEVPPAAGPQEDWERETHEVALHTALQMLSPRAREILRLHFNEELTYESLAQRMQVSRRIVKREIVRSYSALRASLDHERSSSDAPIVRRASK